MNPLKSKIGAADNQDPAHAKYIRNQRSTDQLMKQFCKMESSVDKVAYDRGWIWNFEWNSEGPKARPEKVASVKMYMDGGWSFEEAFDLVMRNFDSEK